MKEINVRSGELGFCDQQPALFSTVVGVCVTVCLWDAVTKRGGMCHYSLPVANADSNTAQVANDYGSEAIVALLRKFNQCGSQLGNLQARVLGGGDLQYGEFTANQHIGRRNIAIALRTLEEFGIAVLGQSVGGAIGRQVEFNAGSGEVSFKAIHCDDFSESLLQQVPATNRPADQLQIKVLVIDPSTSMRNLLQSKIEKDPDFTVIAQASNIKIARQVIESQAPDVITLDLDTRDPQWLELIESYIQSYQTPMLIITSLQQQDSEDIFKALDLGVFNYIDKSSLVEVHGKLKAAHQSKRYLQQALLLSQELAVEQKSFDANHHDSALVLLGASTGGVDALEVVLKQLPASTPPICIVQHIPKDYSGSLAQRLNEVCAVTVCEAVDGTEVLKDHVYIAQGGRHLKVAQLGPQKLVLRLTDEEPNNGFKPSVDTLFHSARKVKGWNMVAVVLTGMGRDGAQGLLELKRQGVFTIVQNEASSVVYGMAKVATEMGAVCRATSITGICGAIIEAVVRGAKKSRHSGPAKDAVKVRSN
ncbi:MAG: response regulator [Pseudomonadales bacterium]|nr:response regulator [Pseudomonadales bacterium]NRA17053.1 response regulator [Oceanospirillaceae bacterium]